MESIAYILIFTLAIGTLFFAIAFREPPRIQQKKEEQLLSSRMKYKIQLMNKFRRCNVCIYSDLSLHSCFDQYL